MYLLSMVFINILAFQLKISVNFLDSFAKLYYINSGTHTLSHQLLLFKTCHKNNASFGSGAHLCPRIKGRDKAIRSSTIA